MTVFSRIGRSNFLNPHICAICGQSHRCFQDQQAAGSEHPLASRGWILATPPAYLDPATRISPTPSRHADAFLPRKDAGPPVESPTGATQPGGPNHPNTVTTSFRPAAVADVQNNFQKSILQENQPPNGTHAALGEHPPQAEDVSGKIACGKSNPVHPANPVNPVSLSKRTEVRGMLRTGDGHGSRNREDPRACLQRLPLSLPIFAVLMRQNGIFQQKLENRGGRPGSAQSVLVAGGQHGCIPNVAGTLKYFPCLLGEPHSLFASMSSQTETYKTHLAALNSFPVPCSFPDLANV